MSVSFPLAPIRLVPATINIDLTFMTGESRGDLPKSCHSVEIDLDKRKPQTSPKKKLLPEEKAFGDLLLSQLEDDDFNFLETKHFAYKNKITEAADINEIEGYFDYDEVELNGLMYDSGKKEKIITLNAFPSSAKHCKEMGLDFLPLKLRLIRVELDTGESEILITSLLDPQNYPQELFAELYHLRWPVEEDYKTVKQWIEIENFSGKSVLSVYQDFHAKVFSKNLISALIYPTQATIDKNTENHVYRYKRNFAQVLSKVKDVIPLLFLRPLKAIAGLISDIHDIVVKTIEPIRPGRKYPRNFNNRSGRFHYGYQPASPLS